MNVDESIEIEDDVEFRVIRINSNSFDDINKINKYGFCKIIIKVDNIIRTYYFSNNTETSRENIIQNERIKKLRR